MRFTRTALATLLLSSPGCGGATGLEIPVPALVDPTPRDAGPEPSPLDAAPWPLDAAPWLPDTGPIGRCVPRDVPLGFDNAHFVHSAAWVGEENLLLTVHDELEQNDQLRFHDGRSGVSSGGVSQPENAVLVPMGDRVALVAGSDVSVIDGTGWLLAGPSPLGGVVRHEEQVVARSLGRIWALVSDSVSLETHWLVSVPEGGGDAFATGWSSRAVYGTVLGAHENRILLAESGHVRVPALSPTITLMEADSRGNLTGRAQLEWAEAAWIGAATFDVARDAWLLVVAVADGPDSQRYELRWVGATFGPEILPLDVRTWRPRASVVTRPDGTVLATLRGESGTVALVTVPPGGTPRVETLGTGSFESWSPIVPTPDGCFAVPFGLDGTSSASPETHTAIRVGL